MEKKLAHTSESRLAVLNAQINEILTTELEIGQDRYETPCYFAMSVFDPILCFDTTLSILQNHFLYVNIVRLTYPYHQPPKPFTYSELNGDFYETVEAFFKWGANST